MKNKIVDSVVSWSGLIWILIVDKIDKLLWVKIPEDNEDEWFI